MNATHSRMDAAANRLNRELVEQLAQERGWTTAEQIADGLGIDRATYFRTLGNKSAPLLSTALRMAERAGVSVLELFPPVEQAA